MTTAWYGHLKYRKAPLIAAIEVSWRLNGNYALSFLCIMGAVTLAF